ncbi:glycerol-3-phosphate acyltransferase 2, mitochondrial isoform X2 [Pseudophryne corroboree]|uniref:glycerol-3-phosphate acyltransferase 2, mitochondrial isoform X2 n=1 Tax=Pseudophryne corroboree TaxID=495146 RepID=UPI0030819E63
MLGAGKRDSYPTQAGGTGRRPLLRLFLGEASSYPSHGRYSSHPLGGTGTTTSVQLRPGGSQRNSRMGSETAQQHHPSNGKIMGRICPLSFGLKLDTIFPFQGQYRPFVGQPCQTCNPKSMETFFYKRNTHLGFHNALHITEEDTRYRGWLVRRLCYVFFMWERPADQDFSEMTEPIYNHPSVQSAINEELQMESDVKHAHSVSTATSNIGHKEVLRILGNIQKSLSPFLIRLTRWILVKLLNRMYLNLQLHCGQLATIKDVSDACPRTPLVYLCAHPSWLDGFIVPFLLFSQNIKVPRVAWDRTDCSPLLRCVLQKLGAVFLPPDVWSRCLSRTVLSAYTRTLLKDGQSLLVFLESSSSPCCHTLSLIGCEWVWQIMEAMQSGVVSDILIVPVGISYDTIPECASAGRKPDSFLGVLFFLTSALCPWSRTLGCARVDFAQPFSLQEYINNYTWRYMEPAPCLRETLQPYILGTRKTLHDNAAPVSGDPGAAAVQEETLVNGFIQHSLRAVSCSAVMSSHMVSALLLHKYRAGVSLSRLLSQFSSMTEDILLHGFDVGFSGQRWDVLCHSLYNLRRCVSLYSVPSNDTYVLCRGTQASIRELGQKSAALLSVFLYEAIGACAVHALLAQLPTLCLVEILFTQNELIEMMVSLCSLLPKNILLQPPCRSLYVLCQDIMDKLIHCGLLSMYEDPSATPACDTGRRRFMDRLTWKAMDEMSDSDIDSMEETIKRHYKLGRSDHHADFFVFLCHLLSPVLKTYERAAIFLQEYELCGHDTETDYVNRLQSYLLQKAEEDGSYECAEHSLAACAVRTFIDLGVFECSQSCHGPIIHLSESFLLKENCKKLESFIQRFIYKG